MRSALKERGQGRLHGEWHGAEPARGVLEQANAISTASSATQGRNAATTAAWSSALPVKRVQNPRLRLSSSAHGLEPQQHLQCRSISKCPARGCVQLRSPREPEGTACLDPLQCTQTSTGDANGPPEPVFMFTLFSCMACLQMLASSTRLGVRRNTRGSRTQPWQRVRLRESRR